MEQGRFIRNVILKAFGLFFLVNLVFTAWSPMDSLGRISAYNHLFPGRLRLPYSDNPQRSYSLSLNNLEAMFASQALAGSHKSSQEFRVLLIGDSSTWGFLLPPTETLAEAINSSGVHLPDRRQLRAYNLGYPVMSLTKDLLILEYSLRYQPDLILWLVTLESFLTDKQLDHALLRNNPEQVYRLIDEYDLGLNFEQSEWITENIWQRTLFGQRRELADLWRLQLYGVLWAATGIDQDIPVTYTPPQADFSDDLSYYDMQPPRLDLSDLALDVLESGIRLAGSTPVLLVNEPVFVSQGQNSHLRYNFYYPRWAYDDYRSILMSIATDQEWNYVDLWDLVPPNEFTNSAVHLTPNGTKLLAQALIQSISRLDLRDE